MFQAEVVVFKRIHLGRVPLNAREHDLSLFIFGEQQG